MSINDFYIFIYEKNPHNPYCAFQIPSKLAKVDKKFRNGLKSNL